MVVIAIGRSEAGGNHLKSVRVAVSATSMRAPPNKALQQTGLSLSLRLRSGARC